MKNKTINDLNSKIKTLYDKTRVGEVNVENATQYVYDIINAAVEVFKDESIKLYVPLYKNTGSLAIYQEEDRLYMPVLSDIELVDEPDMFDYIETNLKEICSEQYKNKTMFELYDNPEAIYKSDYTPEEIKEYVTDNIRINGIIYNPFTDYVYSFEDWQFMALFMKGIGADTFNVIDEETGETKYEL